MSFQAIQAMDSGSRTVVEPRDNSGQGEYLQWVDENDTLSSEEKELLREVHYDG